MLGTVNWSNQQLSAVAAYNKRDAGLIFGGKFWFKICT
jgi:hypothetical protein